MGSGKQDWPGFPQSVEGKVERLEKTVDELQAKITGNPYSMSSRPLEDRVKKLEEKLGISSFGW
jgi:hypothetical protein